MVNPKRGRWKKVDEPTDCEGKPDRVVDFAGQFILLNLMKPGGCCQTPSASFGDQNVTPSRL